MLAFGDRERRDRRGQALGHAAGPASAVGSCAIAPVFSAFAVMVPVALIPATCSAPASGPAGDLHE